MGLSGTPIVVLGMHRSGTSVVANILTKLGAYWGREDDLVPPDPGNESGYWELKDILDVNRKCLGAFDMAYDRVRPIPENWSELPRAESYVNQMEGILKQHHSNKRCWGWKEPITTILVPLYKEVFRRHDLKPHYLVCVRNPLDVAASLARRDRTPEILSMGLWLRYTLAALKESIGESRSIVLYRALLEDTRSALMPTVSAVAELLPDDDAWVAACSVVRTDLSHSWRPVEELEPYPSIVKRTFELCREAVGNPGAFQEGVFDARILELWDELDDLQSMFLESGLQKGTVRLGWRSGSGTNMADCNFWPSSGWQSLTLAVPAPPGSNVMASIYHLPCTVWVRKAHWKVRGKSIPAMLQAGPDGRLVSEQGCQRLSVSLGQNQLKVQTPNASGPYELELEFLVEMNLYVSLDFIRQLTLQLNVAQQQLSTIDRLASRMAPGPSGVRPESGSFSLE